MEGKKMRVLVARLAYGGWECSGLCNWLGLTSTAMQKHPLIADILHVSEDTFPTPSARNRVVRQARNIGADLLVMVDADTIPHLQFLPTAVEFLSLLPSPGVVVSPYVCAPPEERVQVFRRAPAPAAHVDG